MKIGDLVRWTPDDPDLAEHLGVIFKEEPDPRLGDFYIAWQYGQITCESPHAFEVINEER